LILNTRSNIVQKQRFRNVWKLIATQIPTKFVLMFRYWTNRFTFISGLAVPTVGVNAFVTAKDLVDKMVSVRWVAYRNLLCLFCILVIVLGYVTDT